MTCEIQAIFIRPTFFCLLCKCLLAIVNCECLMMYLPKTMEELEDIRKGFEGISIEEVTSGCFGVLDGHLLGQLVGKSQQISGSILVDITNRWG